MNILTEPYFLQQKRVDEVANISLLIEQGYDYATFLLSCIGEITITSIKDGKRQKQKYKDLSNESISVEASAGSVVVISGNITSFSRDPDFYFCSKLIINSLSLKTLDITSNGIIEYEFQNVSNLENLILYGDFKISKDLLARSPKLRSLEVYYYAYFDDMEFNFGFLSELEKLCIDTPNSLSAIDISKNKKLTYFSVNFGYAPSHIRCEAKNRDVVNALIGIMSQWPGEPGWGDPEYPDQGYQEPIYNSQIIVVGDNEFNEEIKSAAATYTWMFTQWHE